MKSVLAKTLLIGTLAVAGVAAFAAPAAAQDDTRASVSVGAAFMKWVDFTFTSKGVAFDVVKPIGKMPAWGVVGDVSWLTGDGETDTSFLGGLRYSGGNGRVKLFGQALFGAVHWVITDDGSNTGIGVVPGGGIIIVINDRVGVKGQVDYFLMKWNDGVDDGDLVRYWFGVDIKLGKKK